MATSRGYYTDLFRNKNKNKWGVDTPSLPEFKPQSMAGTAMDPYGFNKASEFGKARPTQYASSTLQPKGTTFDQSSQRSFDSAMAGNSTVNANQVGAESTKPSLSQGKGLNTAAQLAGTAGSALTSSAGGDNPMEWEGKDTAKQVGGAALQGASYGAAAAGAATTLGVIGAGAAAGSVVPVIGTAVGAVVGAAVGIFGAKKKKKEAGEAQEKHDIAQSSIESSEEKQRIQQRSNNLINTPTPTGSILPEEKRYRTGYGNGYYLRRGGKVNDILIKSETLTLKKKSNNEIIERDIDDLAATKSDLFRLGGILSSIPESVPALKNGGDLKGDNIVPNGVLHEEDNQLGDKGMPVVQCKSDVCVKKYEIERDELILTKDTTKKIEAMLEGGEIAELGNFVKDQILNNTHSFTDKFKDLNDRGDKKDGDHSTCGCGGHKKDKVKEEEDETIYA